MINFTWTDLDYIKFWIDEQKITEGKFTRCSRRKKAKNAINKSKKCFKTITAYQTKKNTSHSRTMLNVSFYGLFFDLNSDLRKPFIFSVYLHD